jgi:hypothetical protein
MKEGNKKGGRGIIDSGVERCGGEKGECAAGNRSEYRRGKTSRKIRSTDGHHGQVAQAIDKHRSREEQGKRFTQLMSRLEEDEGAEAVAVKNYIQGNEQSERYLSQRKLAPKSGLDFFP